MLVIKKPLPQLDDITALGQFLNYKDLFIDLECHSCHIYFAIMREEWCELGLDENLVDDIHSKAFHRKDYGENEEDYELALTSTNPNVRALVALNGKHLDITVKDEAAIVRLKTIDALRGCLSREESERDADCDPNNLLADLVNDPSSEVRERMGYTGKEQYYAELAHDADPKVRAVIASYHSFNEQMLTDPSSEVRAVANHHKERWTAIDNNEVFDEHPF